MLSQDLRYALRTLVRWPGFTAVVVLTLALGIGANAAIFSLINAVMLRTLPVHEPGRLVQITRLLDGRPGVVSYPLFEYFRSNIQSVSAAFAQATRDLPVVVDGDEEFVVADIVSGSYSRVLGIDAAAGRLLAPADDDLSSPPAAVISDGYWQRRFGRNPSAIGKSVTIANRTFTIVGVTPAGYRGTQQGRPSDLMLPLQLMMNRAQREASDFNWLTLLARLKPGATVEQADAEARVLYRAFVQEQAVRAGEKDRARILGQQAVAVPAADGFNQFRYVIARPLLLLMGIVALVLLLACVNLSGLLLARAAARQRETSIRLAIGASRGRLVRQFLTESLVLAMLGGGIGLVIAGWFSTRLFLLFASGRDINLSVAPDWRVLAFTGVVSLLASCMAGLTPAWQAVRVNANPALKEVPARRHHRLGKALVVGQLAISMVLVVGAALFIGTLVKLYAIDRGFDADGVLVVNIRTSRTYPAERALIVQTALVDRLKALPDVRAASAAQVLPVTGNLWDRTVQVEGYSFRPDEPEEVGFNAIAPQYFETLATPVLAGREFTERDTSAAPRVAIVNESFARYFFGDQSALGRRVTSADVAYEIVGVVRDAKYQSLTEPMLRTMYIPWMQREDDQPPRYSYLVRVAAGDPLRLVPQLDRLVRDADPALRVRTALPYHAIVNRSIATERIMAALGGLFGLLAVIVAAMGVFGVLAFQVARRTNELGVRMALGASRRQMVALVLRDVLVIVVAGVSIGAGAAMMATNLARKSLFGLAPTDPVVFVVAASLLALTALAAGLVPARRASRVDPLVALRHE